MTLFLTALAGGVGGALRFWVDTAVSRAVRSAFPWGTLVVNISACLVLGLITGLAYYGGAGAEDVRTVLGVGLLGGYSTFSTASVEAVRLIRQRRYGASLAHAVGMLALSVAAATLGIAVGEVLAD